MSNQVKFYNLNSIDTRPNETGAISFGLDSNGLGRMYVNGGGGSDYLIGQSLDRLNVGTSKPRLDKSCAIGLNCSAGSKCYKVTKAVAGSGGQGTYTLRTVSGLAKNMEYVAVLNKANYVGGKILSISGNTITVDGYVHSDLNALSDSISDGKVYNYIMIKGHPELGDMDSGCGMTALGMNTEALSAGSFSAGSGTAALGKYSFVAGSGSIAGHCGVALGNTTKALGDNSVAMGQKCQALGNASTAFGNNTIAKASSSFTTGIGTVTNRTAGVAFGAYNVGENDSLLEVGMGSESYHLNAFVIKDNGDADIRGSITVGENIYIEGKINPNSTLYIDSLNASNSLYSSRINIGYNSSSSGTNAIALGYGCKANGSYSVAMGKGSTTTSNTSISVGNTCHAKAESSVVIGCSNNTLSLVGMENGDHSVTIGCYNNNRGYAHVYMLGHNLSTTDQSYEDEAPTGQLILGRYNKYSDSTNNKILIIGAGNSDSNRHNALTIDIARNTKIENLSVVNIPQFTNINDRFIYGAFGHIILTESSDNYNSASLPFHGFSTVYMHFYSGMQSTPFICTLHDLRTETSVTAECCLEIGSFMDNNIIMRIRNLHTISIEGVNKTWFTEGSWLSNELDKFFKLQFQPYFELTEVYMD